MLRRNHVYAALLICLAFVFRLLFLNLGILTSSNIMQGNDFVKSNYSKTMKRRKNFDIVTHDKKGGFSVVEICEEENKNEFKIKRKFSLLVKQLCTEFSDQLNGRHKKIRYFDFFDVDILNNRYLVFQSFRI